MSSTPPEVLEKWRSALSEAGMSDRVEIVDERNAHEHIDFMIEMVEAMPDPIEPELPFDGPQRTYSGPPMKGKKGKNRRWQFQSAAWRLTSTYRANRGLREYFKKIVFKACWRCGNCWLSGSGNDRKPLTIRYRG